VVEESKTAVDVLAHSHIFAYGHRASCIGEISEDVIAGNESGHSQGNSH
jgi:elongation factor P hydroxylase